MAAAPQAASSAVAISACSHSMQLTPKRHSFRLSFLRSCFYRHISARPRLQVSCRPWISAVSEIAADSSLNAAPVAVSKPQLKAEEEAPQESSATTKEVTISALLADVTNLIKLVDTRDIVELELKHQDYELVIKKKEALPPPVVAPQLISAQVGQAPYPVYAPPPPVAPAPSAAPTPPAAANVSSLPSPPAQPAAKLARILSPMAGTFYKCPAPGEPSFVKVGDKVSKGQVICIVEAMKLMNEIEADQTGTIVEILAEDGKPVAVDTPLYAIKP
ncbi:hypothetical protein GOP47_0027885 [Adiantum capillus-veneris]|nr:hypothetical protein GOP47_0027343 [Adiantum capillus-veneris]KAI5057870.1 hypothetical protein GOP47_0027885 [Adiantum capillus-veneris]